MSYTQQSCDRLTWFINDTGVSNQAFLDLFMISSQSERCFGYTVLAGEGSSSPTAIEAKVVFYLWVDNVPGGSVEYLTFSRYDWYTAVGPAETLWADLLTNADLIYSGAATMLYTMCFDGIVSDGDDPNGSLIKLTLIENL